MRIGLVLSKPPAYSETFFKSKIQGLTENGHQVTLFCQERTADFDLCPVKILSKVYKNQLVQAIQICLGFISLLTYLSRVKRFYKIEKDQGTESATIFKRIYLNAAFFKSKLDWVHFGFATMALGRELIPKAIDAQCALSFRGFDIAIYPIKYPNCYDRLWSHINKVHTISDDLLNIAYGLGLPKETAYQKITPAIDVSNFKKASNEINDFSDKLQLLTVARLHWKKGLIDTLEGLVHLKKQNIKFQYTIIGAGDQLEEIRFAVDQLDLSEQVHLFGKQPHDQVKSLMSKSHIYIQYSISEGFCNAVLEAQAMGLLCVVSDAEGLPENVEHEVSGLVIPKRNPKALSEALLKLLQMNTEQRQIMSDNAIERVRSKFNLEDQKAAFNSFYQLNK
ncbi:MAG: glycosyltransferase family 4 protein [Flavobacteriaceae bacterium]|nr:glycosyltransferase family 4 protein [Flavobacteriaceae bacterium]